MGHCCQRLKLVCLRYHSATSHEETAGIEPATNTIPVTCRRREPRTWSMTVQRTSTTARCLGNGCRRDVVRRGLLTVAEVCYSKKPMTKPPFMPKNQPTSFAKSLGYAWSGLIHAVVHQRNMRMHIIAAILVGLVASAVPFGLAEKAILIFCVTLILFAEMLDSALEQLVDLAIQQFDEKAKLTKDIAAAGVLVLAIGSMVIFAAILMHERRADLQRPRGDSTAGALRCATHRARRHSCTSQQSRSGSTRSSRSRRWEPGRRRRRGRRAT